jgi:hypothetical protein
MAKANHYPGKSGERLRDSGPLKALLGFVALVGEGLGLK